MMYEELKKRPKEQKYLIVIPKSASLPLTPQEYRFVFFRALKMRDWKPWISCQMPRDEFGKEIRQTFHARMGEDGRPGSSDWRPAAARGQSPRKA